MALGDYAVASAYFAESLPLWERLGYQLEVVRAKWSLANILLNTGRVVEAIDDLHEVRTGFEALGVINDAALTRLQLAEALLLDNRAEDVSTILDGVVLNFSAEGLTRNANLALAYIREAVEANTIEPELLRDVRLYLEELPYSPERVFTRS